MEYRASRMDLALYSTWPCEGLDLENQKKRGQEANAGLRMVNTRKGRCGMG